MSGLVLQFGAGVFGGIVQQMRRNALGDDVVVALRLERETQLEQKSAESQCTGEVDDEELDEENDTVGLRLQHAVDGRLVAYGPEQHNGYSRRGNGGYLGKETCKVKQ